MVQNPSSRTPTLIASATDQAMVRWTKFLALATLGLTVGTLALVGTGIWAIIAADKQSDIATKAEIDAVTQNKISALAQQDTREQLRAVLNITGISAIPGVNPETKEPGYATPVSVHNFGGTRTGHFQAWASTSYFEKDIPDSWDFTKPLKAGTAYDITLGANGTYPLPVGFSSSDLMKPANNQGQAVVWGHISYSDIFNTDVSHEVNFCYNINPTVISGNLVINPLLLRPSCNFNK